VPKGGIREDLLQEEREPLPDRPLLPLRPWATPLSSSPNPSDLLLRPRPGGLQQGGRRPGWPHDRLHEDGDPQRGSYRSSHPATWGPCSPYIAIRREAFLTRLLFEVEQRLAVKSRQEHREEQRRFDVPQYGPRRIADREFLPDSKDAARPEDQRARPRP